MISRRIERKFKQIRNAAENAEDPGLAFSSKWVEHLVTTLKKHRTDKEFSNQVFLSAIEYYKNMSEQDKLDVFAVLLRKSVSGK